MTPEEIVSLVDRGEPVEPEEILKIAHRIPGALPLRVLLRLPPRHLEGLGSESGAELTWDAGARDVLTHLEGGGASRHLNRVPAWSLDASDVSLVAGAFLRWCGLRALGVWRDRGELDPLIAPWLESGSGDPEAVKSAMVRWYEVRHPGGPLWAKEGTDGRAYVVERLWTLELQRVSRTLEYDSGSLIQIVRDACGAAFCALFSSAERTKNLHRDGARAAVTATALGSFARRKVCPDTTSLNQRISAERVLQRARLSDLLAEAAEGRRSWTWSEAEVGGWVAHPAATRRYAEA